MDKTETIQLTFSAEHVNERLCRYSIAVNDTILGIEVDLPPFESSEANERYKDKAKIQLMLLLLDKIEAFN
ncbi:MAG: hypothetical protein PHP85_14695 [Gallionella sp.]|nr:hypothetical protein [Gallionella sp.]